MRSWVRCERVFTKRLLVKHGLQRRRRRAEAILDVVVVVSAAFASRASTLAAASPAIRPTERSRDSRLADGEKDARIRRQASSECESLVVVVVVCFVVSKRASDLETHTRARTQASKRRRTHTAAHKLTAGSSAVAASNEPARQREREQASERAKAVAVKVEVSERQRQKERQRLAARLLGARLAPALGAVNNNDDNGDAEDDYGIMIASQ